MDDWGRISGEIREFKLLVCPGIDVSSKEVEEAINHIVQVGLWIRYTVEEKKCISVSHKESWFKHQSYINKDKRNDDTGSAFPSPPNNTEEHRETPIITEEDKEQPKNPVSFSVSSSFSASPSIISSSGSGINPFKLFESEGFGTISSVIGEKLGMLIDDYGERWVIEAMKVAVIKGKRSLSFVEGVLKNWKADGIDSPWEKESGGNRDAKKFEGQLQHGGSTTKDKPTKTEAIGWLPSPARPANYAEMLEVSGQ